MPEEYAFPKCFCGSNKKSVTSDGIQKKIYMQGVLDAELEEWTGFG